MSDFGHLVAGYRVFKVTTYSEKRDIINHLIRQEAKASSLFVTCSDLRIGPDTIFSSNPGDLFVCRNIGALVPRYDDGGANGVIAAIEYAVCNLEVENVVVLGHTNCDSIKMLMSEDIKKDDNDPIKSWLSVGLDAKEAVVKELADEPEDKQLVACQHESILLSLKNLLTYPFVDKRMKDGSLKVYGWHFDIETGVLLGFDPETKFFEPLE